MSTDTNAADADAAEATRDLTPDVVVVGAGPAGLRAATELARTLSGEVLVLEREREAGGIPRHSDHLGYGIRDLGRFVTGPTYARMLRDKATDAGATILTEAMATDWAGPGELMVTSPEGRLRVAARAVVLASGARERPRAARQIPGDRAHGVLTTGTLQNVVHLKNGTVGKRAVVVGAELVSWSAVLTLRHAGCRTVLMTTTHSQAESYWLFQRPGRLAFKTPVATRTRVTRIIGRPRVQAVEIEDLDTGDRRTVECDTVILTGDWIPDNELARAAGVTLDPRTLGPLVDTALRTDLPGIFAAGNVLHPVDTADIAALDGAAVARHVRSYLDGARPTRDGVRLEVEAPLRWVAPGIVRPGDPAPPRRRLLLWTDEYVRAPRVVLEQGGRVVARRRVLWPAAPGRVFRVPSDLLDRIDARGGTVTVRLDS
ncbi:NAD(P)/FAD-dependent oxidoreductase [Nocardioides sp. T2.26MG-1]|uniref:NAD(P)/FAD-dependent oxidoreductase n=1 Tax=Nocardioides sp. T2.26MG-1 TaxID=3041166 RepID=UPI002477317B|nr:NAD(P)/FAD-dependent oxidoreductase [Nocardioides sp. T2.26MG-1]CAI9403096.1 Ferredoxin--NADP reductase [Nocardioides sp. T2.26MG-1]